MAAFFFEPDSFKKSQSRGVSIHAAPDSTDSFLQ